MDIKLRFELIAVYPDADLHSQFCVISEPDVAKQLRAKMEEEMGQSLPEKFVAKVLMEDGLLVCIFIDEYGVSIMDEAAVHWWGDKEIKAPEYTVIFFHY